MKNEVRLEIKKAGINGEGIGFWQRKPVFIPGCFPDETVLCNLEDEGRYWRGELVKVLKKSPHRIRPACRHCRNCGACTLMELDYEEQLAIKKQLQEGALYKYVGIPFIEEDIVPSPDILHYRNKVNLPVFEYKGKLQNAIYRQGSNHPVLIEDCPIHEQRAEEIRKALLEVLNGHRSKAYDRKEKKGIRQIVVRGFGEEYQAVIITGKDDLSEIIGDLKKIEGLVSVFQGINTRKDPVRMMPEKLKKLYGKDKIAMDAGGFELRLSPQAFFQLNHDQAERIYSDAAALLPKNCERIIEAYCGIGTISLCLADKAKEIIGIELEKKAVEDAKENARINHFEHIDFVAEDAAKGIRNILKKKKVDALVVDPPRTGLDDELLKTLLLSKIGTIVYISCNPATLGKDLNVLKERYDIKLIRGYDMFPNTPLVETLVLLNRKAQGKKDL